VEKRKNKSQKESKQLRSFRSLEQECDLKEKRRGRGLLPLMKNYLQKNYPT
jgi:hypothetical protein